MANKLLKIVSSAFFAGLFAVVANGVQAQESSRQSPSYLIDKYGNVMGEIPKEMPIEIETETMKPGEVYEIGEYGDIVKKATAVREKKGIFKIFQYESKPKEDAEKDTSQYESKNAEKEKPKPKPRWWQKYLPRNKK